jgi:dihydropyrimidinase
MKSFEYDLVITNGICITAADIASYDIAIKDEKIVLLAPPGSLAQADARKIIDAEGGYVTVSPGKCWELL